MKLLQKIQEKTKSSAAAAPIKLAFLGDSITHGCFELIETRPEVFDCIYDFEAVYHTLLKKKIECVFPNCPVSVINAGISGDCAFQGAQRVQRDVIAAQPDLAVVMYGWNDVHLPEGVDGYVRALRDIFTQLQQADIDVIFMSPSMGCTRLSPQVVGTFPKEVAAACCAVQTNGRMDDFIQAARTLCSDMGIAVCDCYTDWKRLEALGADITDLLSNHINHPTRAMHQLFAAVCLKPFFYQK